jgi:hypothetical protein
LSVTDFFTGSITVNNPHHTAVSLCLAD